ncbi:MAG: SpaA isopeptide-forming pilin-related protein [Anaerovoracaceae bacterium]|jgi:fimbrial isopeptide formation D2 family protein/LPXTG-motif cell wall-anchored protein
MSEPERSAFEGNTKAPILVAQINGSKRAAGDSAEERTDLRESYFANLRGKEKIMKRKTLKKLMIVVLAVITTMAMSATAFAGSITINPANSGKTYTAYQILKYNDGKYYLPKSVTTDSDLYKLLDDTDKCNLDFHDEGSGENLIHVVDSDSLPSTDTAKKEFINILTANKQTIINNALETSETATGSSDSTPSTAVIDNTVSGETLSVGYWYIDTNSGSIAIINKNDQDITVGDKNSIDIDKQVTGGNPSGYQGVGTKNDGDKVDNSASVGDTLTYKVKLTVNKDMSKFIFYDKLSTGLQLQKDSWAVYVGDPENGGTAMDSDYYTVTTPSVPSPVQTDAIYTGTGNKINLQIDMTNYLSQIPASEYTKDIYVTYNVKITEAARKLNNVDNTATLQYGNDTETISDKTVTDLFGFKVKKVDKNGTTLNGAKFKLYASDKSTVVIGETSGTDGIFTFQGLKAGTYYLKETVAPTDSDGNTYQLLDGYIKVEISSTGTVTAYDTDETTALDVDSSGTLPIFNVTNYKKGELPTSGGIGTTMFYIIGGLLVAGAVAALVIRKKKSLAE